MLHIMIHDLTTYTTRIYVLPKSYLNHPTYSPYSYPSTPMKDFQIPIEHRLLRIDLPASMSF